MYGRNQSKSLNKCIAVSYFWRIYIVNFLLQNILTPTNFTKDPLKNAFGGFSIFGEFLALFSYNLIYFLKFLAL